MDEAGPPTSRARPAAGDPCAPPGGHPGTNNGHSVVEDEGEDTGAREYVDPGEKWWDKLP